MSSSFPLHRGMRRALSGWYFVEFLFQSITITYIIENNNYKSILHSYLVTSINNGKNNIVHKKIMYHTTGKENEVIS